MPAVAPAVSIAAVGNQLETAGSVFLDVTLTGGTYQGSPSLVWTVEQGTGRVVAFGTNRAIYAIVNITADDAVTIRCTATVTDSDGSTASAYGEVSFTVTAVRQAPRPVINTRAQTISAGETLQLDATDSDPGGAVVSRQWSAAGNAGSFASASTRRARWTAPTIGTGTVDYVLTYTVTDDDGQSASATVVITVKFGSIDAAISGGLDGALAPAVAIGPLPERFLAAAFDGGLDGALAASPGGVALLPILTAGAAFQGGLVGTLVARASIFSIDAAFQGGLDGALVARARLGFVPLEAGFTGELDGALSGRLGLGPPPLIIPAGFQGDLAGTLAARTLIGPPPANELAAAFDGELIGTLGGALGTGLDLAPGRLILEASVIEDGLADRLDFAWAIAGAGRALALAGRRVEFDASAGESFEAVCTVTARGEGRDAAAGSADQALAILRFVVTA